METHFTTLSLSHNWIHFQKLYLPVVNPVSKFVTVKKGAKRRWSYYYRELKPSRNQKDQKRCLFSSSYILRRPKNFVKFPPCILTITTKAVTYDERPKMKGDAGQKRSSFPRLLFCWASLYFFCRSLYITALVTNLRWRFHKILLPSQNI